MKCQLSLPTWIKATVLLELAVLLVPDAIYTSVSEVCTERNQALSYSYNNKKRDNYLCFDIIHNSPVGRLHNNASRVENDVMTSQEEILRACTHFSTI